MLQTNILQHAQFQETDGPPHNCPNSPKHTRPMTLAERASYDAKKVKSASTKAAKTAKVARDLAAGIHVNPKRRHFRNRAIAAAAEVAAAAVVVDEEEEAAVVGGPAVDQYVVKGYVGQPKGYTQLLFERGLYLPNMRSKYL